MATKATPPKGPFSHLPAGPEHRQRSSNQFCRCGHNRSFHMTGLRHVCREPSCECVKHDTATMPKKAKLALVEPSPNAMARDAAIGFLRKALTDSYRIDSDRHIEDAIVTLGGIS